MRTVSGQLVTQRLDQDRLRLQLGQEPRREGAQFLEVFRRGLWLSRAPDGNIAVGDVAHGSAAQLAGIEPGDEIVAIDGKPSPRIRIYRLRQSLNGPPGAAFTLTVKQGAKERSVRLLLAERI